MKNLSIGKIRGLQEISTTDGYLTVLALDQRGSLIHAMGLEKEDPGLYEKIRDFKLDTVQELLPYCSAVLLDPQYSAAEAIHDGMVSGQKGIIVTTEETGYVEKPDGRTNQLIPGWSLEKAKRMGASASKLLVYYNPKIHSLAKSQEEFVRSLSDIAEDLDLPLLLEPMSYSSDPEIPKNSEEFAQMRPQIVLDTVKNMGHLRIDLLKLEFPCDVNYELDESVWLSACEQITEHSPVPWVLLSAGVNFNIFKKQLDIACRAGASGFVAGRAIWKEAASLNKNERIDFLKNTAVKRTEELVTIVQEHATPWKDSLENDFAKIDENWIAGYNEFKK